MNWTKEAYEDKSCNNMIKEYDEIKVQIEKTGEELTMKNIHVIPHCHGLTPSNPTKLFEKGWQINFIKLWRYH